MIYCRLTCLGVILAIFAMGTGCGHPQGRNTEKATDPIAILESVKTWVDSLKGLSVEEARRVFGDTQPAESTWSHGDKGGPQMTFEFPEYTVDLYCSDDRVVLVSIDVSPE